VTSTDFVVARNDLAQCRLIETAIPDAAALPADALLVKVRAAGPTPCGASISTR
jgi:hypothetical protein